MDPILIASGLLALLGGGAGAVAWYRTNYGNVVPPLPPATAGQDPATLDAGYVNIQGGSIAQVDSSGNVIQVSAGVISPYVKPGASVVKGYTAPAPTKGATLTNPNGILSPLASFSSAFSGLEAHL